MIPNKLKKGDIIGVIAPSDPVEKEDTDEMNASAELMKESGFTVKYGKNIFSNSLGYSASVEEKVEDIHRMFKDDNIKAIFCSTGGCNSNSVFDYLDYELIKENPKILCGFSDSTSLTNVITLKAGLVTFNGPTFKSLTSWDTDYGYKEVIKRFVEGDLTLGTEDDVYKTIKHGIAEGELIGGNLSLTRGIVSGKYALDFKDKILFIEESGYESCPTMVSNYLYFMKQNKVFEQIKGIWIGNYEHKSGISLEKIVLDTIGKDFAGPIIKSDNFGHIDKKTVIPIGTKAKIDTSEITKIKLIENCVNG